MVCALPIDGVENDAIANVYESSKIKVKLIQIEKIMQLTLTATKSTPPNEMKWHREKDGNGKEDKKNSNNNNIIKDTNELMRYNVVVDWRKIHRHWHNLRQWNKSVMRHQATTLHKAYIHIRFHYLR